ncbi:protein DWD HYPERSENSITIVE TO UV-B 1 isoform X1 [Ziziphus jujuba]|uniref:Protein DWD HYPERSENSITIVE TO UV-B 1 isoform X1 n=2 Tax=Ziziphus jujuba TaxID=326968 RepID=A0A6P3YVU4_ZIZJJ|nr:protein DWD HYPERSENSITIVE TO UV-B 1 isoform X1 [Ziziphus jujuba]
MAVDIQALKERYINTCRMHGVLPNNAILSAFLKAEVKRFCHEPCSLEIFLHHLKDIDFHSLLGICLELDGSEIEAVDVCNGSSCMLNGEYALVLMRAINKKLRVVDLKKLSFGKDFLRDLSQRGLPCQALTLSFSHVRKLNMKGEFMRIHTLNLDFSSSLTGFHEDCFTCMPNLKHLSLCETRISNLWTTSAALSKLPSLVELQFQNWLCCKDSGVCSTSSSVKSDNTTDSSEPNAVPYFGGLSVDIQELMDHNSSTAGVIRNFFSLNEMIVDRENPHMLEDSSDDSETEYSSYRQEYGYMEPLSDVFPGWNGQVHPQNEVSIDTLWNQNEEESSVGSFTTEIADVSLKYISNHASPICFEKHYREYMIASLPHLRVLDNLPIRKIDKERAAITYSEHFEHLPYRRKHKESVVSILQKREIKSAQIPARNSSYPSRKAQQFYTKSLCAAKVGSSAWPFMHPLSILGTDMGDEGRNFRPRQFEYHPSDSSLMVFGTLDGEVVVVNHEKEKIVSYIPSLGAMNSVLGLCWLKKYPTKLIAGSDNGSLKLYDIHNTPHRIMGSYSSAGSVTFDEFDQLTSVHVNSTDELFLASGYSRNVALYDISTGRRLHMFTDMHREHINVVKFANHSPSIFVTSSFDQDVKMWDLRQKPLRACYTASSSRGNVMVCFSPDDHYLLVSAVDNEIRQLLAVDGRLHLNFGIAHTGSSQNYTRSYYMNGRDYIISGSCDEHVVRICCAQTGRRLRDISLEGRGSGTSMYVQSLRGDPSREFNMSILAAYMRPSSRSEIFKVNMLLSSDYDKEYSSQQPRPINSMGG